MKRLIFLIIMILFVFPLSACSKQPYTGPDGTTFIKTDELEFFAYNYQDKQLNLVYSFDFIEELMYFDVIGLEAYEFTQINDYKKASYELNRFIKSHHYAIKYEFVADYGDRITLSLGATETNYNEIKVAVSEATDIDGYFITDEGYMIVFLYSELDTEEGLILVPSAMYFFNFEIYTYDSCEVTESDVAFTNITPHVVPVLPLSEVYVTNNDQKEVTLQNIIDSGAFDCTETQTSLTGTIHESFTEEDLYAFYSEYYQGAPIGDTFVFHHNDEMYTIEVETDEFETTTFVIEIVQ